MARNTSGLSRTERKTLRAARKADWKKTLPSYWAMYKKHKPFTMVQVGALYYMNWALSKLGYKNDPTNTVQKD